MDTGALPVVIAGCLAAAIVSGLVEGFISRWFSLLLIFPAILGAAVGLVGTHYTKAKRLRNPMVAATIGALMGLVSQLAVHAMEYQHARSVVGEVLQKDPGAAAFVEANGLDRAVDVALAGESGSSPIAGYIQLVAKRGVTISHAGGSSHGPTLTGVACYVLWATEFLLVAGIAALIIASQAREPFCESCNAWYTAEEVLATGSGDKNFVDATVRRLEHGQFEDAVREIGSANDKGASILSVRGCAACKTHEPVIVLKRLVIQGKKQETKTAYTSLVTQADIPRLRQTIPIEQA